MNSERWSEARELFDRALALSRAERAAFVDERAGGDPELRQEVLSLLAAHDSAGGFLAGTHVGALARSSGESEEEPPSPVRERIGAWRIVGTLGRGGMGVVYLAARDADDYEQSAAIKVVSGGLENAAIVRRFQTERRLLAGLDHPGIARLLDGGTTEDGLPYFVLEYVEGEELFARADRLALDVDRRLRLFLEVCAAVEHAHQRLVLHRDLKPSNILVGADGHAKLLDFGIGKLVRPAEGDAGGEAMDATATLDRWLTPRYASPEQILGRPTTTATDVYSLGVVLFELLTGAAPYRYRGTSPRELEAAVLEQTPRRLASATTEAEAVGRPESTTAEERASRRGTNPKRLRRRLRGDLETIVAKALFREPDRRYASVADLAADLERYLAGKPVRARPASRRYRAAKFVGRHRLAVASAAVVVVALGAFSAYHVVTLQRERDVARREAASATEIASFLTKLFQGANLVQTGGTTLTARDLLERGEKQLEERTDLDPVIRGRLLVTMALARESLGDAKRAAELANRASDVHEAAASPADDRVFALLLKASFLIGDGRNEEAIPIIQRAAALAESSSEVPVKTRAKAAMLLGNAYFYTGDEAHAKTAYERFIELEKQIGSPARIGSALNNLGAVLRQMGDDAGARARYLEAVAYFEKSTEKTAYDIYLPLENLAELDMEAGALASAETYVRRAKVAYEKVFGSENKEVAWILAALAEIEGDRGELGRARESIDRALALYAKLVEPGQADWSWPLRISGKILLAEGKRESAIAELERALAIERSQEGDRSDWIEPIEKVLAEARGSAPAQARAPSSGH